MKCRGMQGRPTAASKWGEWGAHSKIRTPGFPRGARQGQGGGGDIRLTASSHIPHEQQTQETSEMGGPGQPGWMRCSHIALGQKLQRARRTPQVVSPFLDGPSRSNFQHAPVWWEGRGGAPRGGSPRRSAREPEQRAHRKPQGRRGALNSGVGGLRTPPDAL